MDFITMYLSNFTNTVAGKIQFQPGQNVSWTPKFSGWSP